MRKIRCANGQIIKSPVSVTKTQTAIRNGVGTLSFSSPEMSQESANENDIIEDYLVKSPMKIDESPSGSISSKDNLAKKNKEGKMGKLNLETKLNFLCKKNQMNFLFLQLLLTKTL